MKTNHLKKKKRDIKTILFLICIFAWPTFCFVWSHIIVNVNAFTLAFATYDDVTRTFTYNAGFSNFVAFFQKLKFEQAFSDMFWRSLLNTLINLAFVPVPILVSYMIYKKCPFSNFFIVILFLPSVISSIIWVISYKYMLEYVIPNLFKMNMVGSMLKGESAFWLLQLYMIIMNFAGGLVLYTGAMGRIPPELLEYGKLEGMKAWGELRYVIIPMIYPTLSVMLLAMPASIFTGSPNTFAFYGVGAPENTWTIGYYFFSLVVGTGGAKREGFAEASTAGLMMTIVIAPLTFLWKRFLDKRDPEAEY